MMDSIFLGQVSGHSHKCWAIVGNDLGHSGHSSPSAEDILEYKIPKHLLVFLQKRVPLGPRRQGAASPDKIVKLIDGWHEHGININLAEKHGNVRNSRWKVKMTGLASLERMACRNKPLHIFIQNGPPKPFLKI